MFLSTATIAAPTVAGNTISWPDDGWYQVQIVNEDGIFEVCQGGRSCEVQQGEYIVINHSTGERFKNIVVPSVTTPERITVAGNTISWPNDGWYQVQDEITYTEVCGGGLSCTVSPGNYVVINHSTGERFEGIEVTGSSQPNLPITVTGNVISWPYDGWYQVQDSTTFASFCEGGTSCEVPVGTYTVINHTSGTRYENIEVTSNNSDASTIREYLSAINIERYHDYYTRLAELHNLIFNGEYEDNRVADLIVDGEILGSVYECPDGGQIEYRGLIEATGDGSTYRHETKLCQIDSMIFTGLLSATRGFRRQDGREFLKIGANGTIDDKTRGEVFTAPPGSGSFSVCRLLQPKRGNGFTSYTGSNNKVENEGVLVFSVDNMIIQSLATTSLEFSPEKLSVHIDAINVVSSNVFLQDIDGSIVITENAFDYQIDSDIEIVNPDGNVFLQTQSPPSSKVTYSFSDGRTGSVLLSDLLFFTDWKNDI